MRSKPIILEGCCWTAPANAPYNRAGLQGGEQPRHNCLRLAQNRAVRKAIGARGDDGRLTSMPTYKNLNGYEVGPHDRFTLVATYENPTAERVDAMAGIFVFYSAAP